MIITPAEYNKDFLDWASYIIFGEAGHFDNMSVCKAIINNGKLICVVVYNNYQPKISIEMSIASIDKRWATRHNIDAFFKYPFIDLGVKRVQTLCNSKEEDIIMFNQRIGFKPEGLHRCAWHDGGDAISFGMLKSECKWVK